MFFIYNNINKKNVTNRFYYKKKLSQKINTILFLNKILGLQQATNK